MLLGSRFVQAALSINTISFILFYTINAPIFCLRPFFFLLCLLTYVLQTSDTHGRMIEILARAAFVTQEFILSPLQFGVPYSRPRYFCLVSSLFFIVLIKSLGVFAFVCDP